MPFCTFVTAACVAFILLNLLCLSLRFISLTAYAWRTPFLSNRIACTEAPGKPAESKSIIRFLSHLNIPRTFCSAFGFGVFLCFFPSLINEKMMFSIHPDLMLSDLDPLDASSDFSLFEALRETIYSEVATLISQNESRPHFLIELFHELQLLNTDYLRQRALYSLQVTKCRRMRLPTGEVRVNF